MFEDLIVDLYGETTYRILALIFSYYPIWLPLLSAVIFWEFWLRYIRYLFFLKTEMVLIEIKIPREISKSPAAMEVAVLALAQFGGEATFIDKYWDGKVRAYSSLEIVSNGGEVRFYMWIRKNIRDIVESQLYSQYPNIEITEATDYTKQFDFVFGKNDMWACHYLYAKPDAYPIKTYIDYGLDRDPDEEFKHDPLTSVLEFFGTLREGEQLWLQYIVRAHKSEKRGGFFSPKEDWKKAGQAELKKIFEKIKESDRQLPTSGESDQIAAIERHLGKTAFDVGIRVVYTADEKSKLNKTVVTGLRGLMKPFSTSGLNTLLSEDSTDFNYPWEDFRNKRVNRRKRNMLSNYKRRMYFFYPYKGKPLVMTNESLATLYHFPGEVALTPGIPRIPSKRAQAPANLPI